MPKRKLKILDVTIRDGSYVINFSYTPEQISEIVRQLDNAGVPYIEASHGIGVGAARMGYPHGADDISYAKAAAKARKKAKIGAIGHPSCTSPDDISVIAEHVDFFRMICNADNPAPIKHHIERCKKEQLETFVQLSRSSSVDPKAVAKSAKIVKELGADVIYLVDTTGGFIPGDVSRYIESIRKVYDGPLGFHAHNTLQLALSNTLEAIDGGCEFVDASLLGLGRDAGNVSIEALTMVLGRMNQPTPIDIRGLIIAAETVKNISPTQTRASWYTSYLAYHCRDLYPLQLIDILVTECGKTPFEVIDAYVKMKDVVECDVDTLAKLIKKLGGNAELIFKKYDIRKNA